MLRITILLCCVCMLSLGLDAQTVSLNAKPLINGDHNKVSTIQLGDTIVCIYKDKLELYDSELHTIYVHAFASDLVIDGKVVKNYMEYYAVGAKIFGLYTVPELGSDFSFYICEVDLIEGTLKRPLLIKTVQHKPEVFIGGASFSIPMLFFSNSVNNENIILYDSEATSEKDMFNIIQTTINIATRSKKERIIQQVKGFEYIQQVLEDDYNNSAILVNHTLDYTKEQKLASELIVLYNDGSEKRHSLNAAGMNNVDGFLSATGHDITYYGITTTEMKGLYFFHLNSATKNAIAEKLIPFPSSLSSLLPKYMYFDRETVRLINFECKSIVIKENGAIYMFLEYDCYGDGSLLKDILIISIDPGHNIKWITKIMKNQASGYDTPASFAVIEDEKNTYVLYNVPTSEDIDGIKREDQKMMIGNTKGLTTNLIKIQEDGSMKKIPVKINPPKAPVIYPTSVYQMKDGYILLQASKDAFGFMKLTLTE